VAPAHSRVVNALWIEHTNNRLSSKGGGSDGEEAISDIELDSGDESSEDAEVVICSRSMQARQACGRRGGCIDVLLLLTRRALGRR